jgi:hypothetical protein
MASDFDTDVEAIAAHGSDIYYTHASGVYRMVPGANNDVSMASDFDTDVTAIVAY